ncbi:MAG TPA: class IV adenylate cyclase [Candidatus Binatia bacterium]|jgi:predicted adenylyl cyclase CyaB
MPRNVEIKARIESIAALVPKVAAIAAHGPTKITQEDIFFRCETGRLKLRTLSDEDGELIFYRRANETGPKESVYISAPISRPGSLRQVLSCAYGEVGRVEKTRFVYLVGRTRIHLDDVRGLGQFLELEVALNEGEKTEQGIMEAEKLMERLGIENPQLIDRAYVDLLGAANG